MQMTARGPGAMPVRRRTRYTTAAIGAVALPLALALPAAAGSSHSSLSVADLTTERLSNPLGIDESTPRFSWVVDARYNGAEQTAYEIKVSSNRSMKGDVWDSGKVASTDSVDVDYAGTALESQTRYWWSVKVWDHGRTSGWSEPAWFETAFLDVSEFGGEWIGISDIDRLDGVVDTETPEPLLRTDFALSNKKVASARLYISGLGYYKAFINGERVGDHELDPGYTPYDTRILYVTYDVTDMLKRGDNAIGVSLGRGEYSSYGDDDISQAPWLSEPEMKLQLDVTYVDGRTATLVSDDSWKADEGPTLLNSLKNGETYDARDEQPGWTTAGFDDSAWQQALLTTTPTGALEAQEMEPIRVVGTLPEPSLRDPFEVTDGTALVYDFGETTAGWATLGFSGPAGAEVTISYGEKLAADGQVNVDCTVGWCTVPRQTSHYVLSGDTDGETYTPSYSYYGYRFVQVIVPEGVEVTSIEGKVLHSDVATTGTFTSSDELLNRYHEAMVRSLLNNLHSIPTDTPMYEKRGWTSDAMLFSDNSLMNFQSVAFWENWMADHTANQADDGGIPVIVPNETPGEAQSDPFIGRTDDPIWSSSYTLINYALYQRTGDVSTLEANWDGLKAYMDKWVGMVSATGYLFDTTLYRTWGDHEPAYGSGVNNIIVGTAYVYESAVSMAEIARVLGHDDVAAGYEEFAANVKDAINAAYFDEATATYDWPYSAAGGWGPAPSEDELAAINANQFQTDNVLPLELGLVPDEYRDQLCTNLVDDVAVTQENHVTTGAVVLKDVLPMLTECGGAETAYAAAENPTFPGWGYWFLTLDGSIASGGEEIVVDTYWENWTSGARSHDHAFRGTIDDWLYEYVAGIQNTGVAYRDIQIKPYVVGDLTEASASIQTVIGEVSSAWTLAGDELTLTVEVPVGSTATVMVPVADGRSVHAPRGAVAGAVADGYAAFTVGSGEYTFVAG
ncbi:glycoside hydrolase family 78 protein [Actinotalea sp. M2MS4P-6]|uniref:glycoside hydrolase family 78 protein n=1 Tax=Actinotalea sp. M2MS4P-6 TaxID=2983762 RepID=UPI0021E43D14|nr:glycoside hydrolase family 78 protein [Actinotalea sp. M2MS4P-6]MCV2395409.1 glycoside hydrolase family 78 protein [Actinotalea sp. M2MS4P-6]